MILTYVLRDTQNVHYRVDRIYGYITGQTRANALKLRLDVWSADDVINIKMARRRKGLNDLKEV